MMTVAKKKNNVEDGTSGGFTTETWTEKILNKWFRWNLDNIFLKSQKQLLRKKCMKKSQKTVRRVDYSQMNLQQYLSDIMSSSDI